MASWLRDIRAELGEDVILHVVGTKADLVAADPAARQVPFERCIAYVAENLYPAYTATPPATAGGTITARHEENSYRYFLAGLGGQVTNAFEAGAGPMSPSSKRSSGFWGQDVGWDCCHEISAESGEGVEEVFRVVTERLVQRRARWEGGAAGFGGMRDGGAGEREFGGDAGKGSFRVGRDRKSWLGLPPLSSGGPGSGVGHGSVSIEEVQNGVEEPGSGDKVKRRGRCC